MDVPYHVLLLGMYECKIKRQMANNRFCLRTDKNSLTSHRPRLKIVSQYTYTFDKCVLQEQSQSYQQKTQSYLLCKAEPKTLSTN